MNGTFYEMIPVTNVYVGCTLFLWKTNFAHKVVGVFFPSIDLDRSLKKKKLREKWCTLHMWLYIFPHVILWIICDHVKVDFSIIPWNETWPKVNVTWIICDFIWKLSRESHLRNEIICPSCWREKKEMVNALHMKTKKKSRVMF